MFDTKSVVSALKQKLGEEKVSDELYIRSAYTRDISLYSYDYSIPGIIVYPESTEDVVAIIKTANEYMIPVNVVGAQSYGNGNNESHKGLIMDLCRMNKLLDIDGENMAFTVEAGANVHAVNRELKKHGYCYPTFPMGYGPITFGSEIAKNSGGEIGSMYGHVHKRVIALEVVTGTGDIVKTGSSNVIETNAAYLQSGFPDLTQLYIGSECALGVITKVTMQMNLEPYKKCGVDILFPPTDEGLKQAAAFIAEMRNHKGVLANAHICDKYNGWLAERHLTQTPDVSPEAEQAAMGHLGHTAIVEFESFTDDAEIEFKKNLTLKIAEKYGGTEHGDMMANIFCDMEALQTLGYAGGFVGTMIMTNTPYNKLCDLYDNFLRRLDQHGLPRAHSSFIVACGDDATIPFYFPWHKRRDESEPEDWDNTIKEWHSMAFELMEDSIRLGVMPHSISRSWRPYIMDKLDKNYITYMRGIKKVLDPNNILNPGVSIFEEGDYYAD